nr:hypothetical protein [uncultured Nitrososphaera sp.]
MTKKKAMGWAVIQRPASEFTWADLRPMKELAKKYLSEDSLYRQAILAENDALPRDGVFYRKMLFWQNLLILDRKNGKFAGG